MINQSERKNINYMLRFTLSIYFTFSCISLKNKNAQILFLYNRQKPGVLRAFIFSRIFQNMITTFHWLEMTIILLNILRIFSLKKIIHLFFSVKKFDKKMDVQRSYFERIGVFPLTIWFLVSSKAFRDSFFKNIWPFSGHQELKLKV